MGGGGRVDVVNGFAYAMKRGRCTDCEIRHGHVIINGSHKAYDPEVAVTSSLFVRYLAWRSEVMSWSQSESRTYLERGDR